MKNGNTYQWDALNRLTAIVYNSGPHAGTHTDFAYDGLSRRISITERAGTTPGTGTASSALLYLWVGSEIAEERDLTNTVTKRFFPQGEQQIPSGTPNNYYYTAIISVPSGKCSMGVELSSADFRTILTE